MYNIEISRKAKGFLKKIPLKDVSIILTELNNLKDNPFRSLKKLEGYRLWRIKIQGYRAVADVIISAKRIIILRIGHRKKIYKNMHRNI